MQKLPNSHEASVIDTELKLELCDIFYTSQKRGHVFRVKLNTAGILLQRESESGTKEECVNMSDIIGGRCVRLLKSQGSSCSCSSASHPITNSDVNMKSTTVAEDEMDASAYFYIFAYILKKKNLGKNPRRERTVFTLRFRSFDSFDENMREAERWYKALRYHKNYALERIGASRRRLLIMLNPKSGSGKARRVFHQQVTPILNEAELYYDLYVTKYANYARDFVHQQNISSWNGLIAVGGDGLLHEILNGILQRTDWEHVLQHTALGIIPCGSGNGLARTIAHLYGEPYNPKPVLGATLNIVSGKTAPMDVVRIEIRNQVLYSFLSVGWGLISDIDIESERLRSLGYQRFTLWTLHRLVNLRTYHGKISYLPIADLTSDLSNGMSPAFVEEKSTLKYSRSCSPCLKKADHFQSLQSFTKDDVKFDDVISLETSANQSFRSRCDSWFSSGSRKSVYYSISESVYQSVNGESELDQIDCVNDNVFEQGSGPSVTTSLNDPLPDSWIVEEGEFIMVQAAYQTHLGVDCFFAPSSKLNDNIIYLVIIRGGISRSQLFNFLVNMSSGTHLPSKNNEFIKVAMVTAFRIEPADAEGILTVDGERVEFGPLHAEVLPGIANIMVPN